jgi:hypothetical protein
VLRALLGHDPHPFEPYLSLPETPLPGDAANEQWENLLGAAEVASHEWSSSDPASARRGSRPGLRLLMWPRSPRRVPCSIGTWRPGTRTSGGRGGRGTAGRSRSQPGKYGSWQPMAPCCRQRRCGRRRID